MRQEDRSRVNFPGKAGKNVPPPLPHPPPRTSYPYSALSEYVIPIIICALPPKLTDGQMSSPIGHWPWICDKKAKGLFLSLAYEGNGFPLLFPTFPSNFQWSFWVSTLDPRPFTLPSFALLFLDLPLFGPLTSQPVPSQTSLLLALCWSFYVLLVRGKISPFPYIIILNFYVFIFILLTSWKIGGGGGFDMNPNGQKVPRHSKNSANPQWTTSKVDIFRSASPFLPIYIFYIFL
jgi:hypothetical protein